MTSLIDTIGGGDKTVTITSSDISKFFTIVERLPTYALAFIADIRYLIGEHMERHKEKFVERFDLDHGKNVE